MNPSDYCILNTGPGAWAFEEHAQRLSRALWLEVGPSPRTFNYVLAVDEEDSPLPPGSFIPEQAIRLASDKRLLATAFARCGVPTPMTVLVDSPEAVWEIACKVSEEWCLKWPISCGAAGHRLVRSPDSIPQDWPRPYVLQEFIRLEEPAVYRAYSVGGKVFGWNARRFPTGVKPSPWVAHARGARYVVLDGPPPDAAEVAESALACTSLLQSFGCADLMQRPTGEWLVLEVGAEGIYNHVDRDLGDAAFSDELDRKIAEAFWARAGTSPPWGTGGWKRRDCL